MGTRSLTTFVDNFTGKKIVVMYRQYDGYPSGHGKELAEFLDDLHIVNGINMNDERTIANGMGCLSAQVVSHFKGDDIGHIYLHAPDTKDIGEQYIYTIYDDKDGVKIKVHDTYKNIDIFNGTIKDMKKWITCVEEAINVNKL
jgi:hypothetical protein|tara:strand:+ start:56 stop:484 length:429 start_codon:yes stop_codon:yes gene_type:complete